MGVSLNTVIKYIEHLKEAYIIDEIELYSTKAKKELAYYYKTYLGDGCFNSLSVDDNRFNLDHNLENIVYNELIYRGYELKVFNNKDGKEIDFHASKDGKKYYVQVAYSLIDPKAYEREFNTFKSLDNLTQKNLLLQII